MSDRLAAVLPQCADIFEDHAAVVLVEEKRSRVRFLPIGTDGI